MTTLKIGDDGDLVVTDNNLVLISGADEVGQLIRGRLRTFLGEWFLDRSIGLPYVDEIFQKRTHPDRIASFIKREILSTPGVLGLLSYEQTIDGQTRALSVTFDVKVTNNETLQINEVFG